MSSCRQNYIQDLLSDEFLPPKWLSQCSLELTITLQGVRVPSFCDLNIRMTQWFRDIDKDDSLKISASVKKITLRSYQFLWHSQRWLSKTCQWFRDINEDDSQNKSVSVTFTKMTLRTNQSPWLKWLCDHISFCDIHKDDSPQHVSFSDIHKDDSQNKYQFLWHSQRWLSENISFCDIQKDDFSEMPLLWFQKMTLRSPTCFWLMTMWRANWGHDFISTSV